MSVMVSIIIPVYNAQKTLTRCIESVLSQEFTEFELILVDDGSSDLSGEICNEYVKRDARVKVIHKENSGVSETRNMGIEAAQGKYLQFVDADDWITSDATKLLVREAEENKCELVIADFYRVIKNRVSTKSSIREDGVVTREEFAEHMKDNPADFYYGVLWNKLFCRDIVIQKSIRMDENISWCEDFLFNLEYILHINKVFILHVPIYYYLKTEGSLVSQSMGVGVALRTKLLVFEYYNEFYKNVYDEKEYARKRLGIYRYLIDVAGDSTVAGRIFTNSKKLGEERVPIAQQAISGNDYLTINYRNAKILERYYQTVGLKYELTLNDVKVLAHISQINVVKSKTELADYANLSNTALNRSLQKLTAKKMIEINKGKQCLEIKIIDAGKPVLSELEKIFRDYDNLRFQGFTEEEIGQYFSLQNRIDANLGRLIKGREALEKDNVEKTYG